MRAPPEQKSWLRLYDDGDRGRIVTVLTVATIVCTYWRRWATRAISATKNWNSRTPADRCTSPLWPAPEWTSGTRVPAAEWRRELRTPETPPAAAVTARPEVRRREDGARVRDERSDVRTSRVRIGCVSRRCEVWSLHRCEPALNTRVQRRVSVLFKILKSHTSKKVSANTKAVKILKLFIRLTVINSFYF